MFYSKTVYPYTDIMTGGFTGTVAAGASATKTQSPTVKAQSQAKSEAESEAESEGGGAAWWSLPQQRGAVAGIVCGSLAAALAVGCLVASFCHS